MKDATSKVYDGSVAGVVEIGDEATLKKHNLSLMAGRLPEQDDEIAISDFVFDCFKNGDTPTLTKTAFPTKAKYRSVGD